MNEASSDSRYDTQAQTAPPAIDGIMESAREALVQIRSTVDEVNNLFERISGNPYSQDNLKNDAEMNPVGKIDLLGSIIVAMRTELDRERTILQEISRFI